jgi:hypothetical protein
MDALDALRTISDAYWHRINENGIEDEAAILLEQHFHKIRRSMQSIMWTTIPSRLLTIKSTEGNFLPTISIPLQTPNEGWNGKGPRYF